jgi:hypothetical protein
MPPSREGKGQRFADWLQARAIAGHAMDADQRRHNLWHGAIGSRRRDGNPVPLAIFARPVAKTFVVAIRQNGIQPPGNGEK